MSQQDIIRAWKDAEFRVSLTDAQRSQLPENPAGAIELSDAILEGISGGMMAPSEGSGGCTPSQGGGGCTHTAF